MTHALLKDSGFPAACEKDINALLAMMLKMYLSEKAPYMGNPTVNVEENTLSIMHSDAGLKMKGFDEVNSPYEIKTFTNSGFGATFRYYFNKDKGEVVTVARFDPSATKVLLTKGTIKSGSELFKGIGCAQNVEISIPDGRELMRKQMNFGHHLTMVFGDYTQEIIDLADMMNFEVIAAL
ncbi:MAG: hypothetical protein KAW56_00585 [Candidatus Marinimicrobia bacterium]|nr:hypothetical protein [Candidatus Neomarinimicrobiota bacterium]